MIVRWLGAFASGASLGESLRYELTRAHTDEVAAEPIRGGSKDVRHVRVGLIVKRSAFIKAFRGDCWSVKGPAGILVKTRNPRASTAHKEVWAYAEYVAICIDGSISEAAAETVIAAATKYQLKIVGISGKPMSVIFTHGKAV